MRKQPYRITEAAIKDLENIWDFTFENWSIAQADRYYTLLIDEIKFITNNFTSGKSMEHIRTGYRAAKVKSHLIFYRKGEDGVLEIIRILHQSMDIENRLKG